MSHRTGYCAQCGGQIMVQDMDGRFVVFKSNHTQHQLVFKDGHRMNVAMCKTCAANLDYEKIMSGILAEDSQACSAEIKQTLKERGTPVSSNEVASGR